jgi:hypothetical protein
MPVLRRSSSRVSTSLSDTASGAAPVERRTEPRSAMVSVSVPEAPQDGQLPNHCSAVAPQSEQT